MSHLLTRPFKLSRSLSQHDIVQCFCTDRVRDSFAGHGLHVNSLHFTIACRMKAVFDAYDELCQLWGYAEDLETFEHANKLLLSYCASPVRTLWMLQYVHLPNDYRPHI